MKTSLKKWICVLSNLIASIWTHSICKMQASFPGVEFLRIFSSSKRGKKTRRRMTASPIKRQIRRFHVVIVWWTSKKCTKKRDARVEPLFCSLNLLFFWSCRRRRSSSCLSSLLRKREHEYKTEGNWVEEGRRTSFFPPPPFWTTATFFQITG